MLRLLCADAVISPVWVVDMAVSAAAAATAAAANIVVVLLSDFEDFSFLFMGLLVKCRILKYSNINFFFFLMIGNIFANSSKRSNSKENFFLFIRF